MKNKLFLLTALVVFSVTEKTFAQNSYINDSVKVRGNQFTIDVLTPLKGSITLGYEVSLTRSITLNIRGSYIGLGFNRGHHLLSGEFLKFGPRFYFHKKNLLFDKSRYNFFRGTYINPMLILNHFWFNQVNTVVSQGGFLCLGQQFIFNTRFSFNIYAGVGLAAVKYDLFFSSAPQYLYSHYVPDRFNPFAITGGIEFGILFRSSSVSPLTSGKLMGNSVQAGLLTLIRILRLF